jgi:hypothetical protein
MKKLLFAFCLFAFLSLTFASANEVTEKPKIEMSDGFDIQSVNVENVFVATDFKIFDTINCPGEISLNYFYEATDQNLQITILSYNKQRESLKNKFNFKNPNYHFEKQNKLHRSIQSNWTC